QFYDILDSAKRQLPFSATAFVQAMDTREAYRISQNQESCLGPIPLHGKSVHQVCACRWALCEKSLAHPFTGAYNIAMDYPHVAPQEKTHNECTSRVGDCRRLPGCAASARRRQEF